ncbi:MAG: helix-hairpin-helix domain-containing protein [Rhodanobacteraceae bacterium]|jgi:competence protein ComEA|nr:helix-hairpin-helix domain-containing protein [Rhodanobacteraceae bacterium]MBL0041964.1 helix-hairpin-helix domain-containing protein [Xanthomonadales bacterium]MBP6077778.1 helix-hairpin-helix domain-containing protein [Xanthomonadales bacterium]MBP7622980.1 helix-hairpin-helix domain-containing protein [Xanthomonadales bacterium]
MNLIKSLVLGLSLSLASLAAFAAQINLNTASAAELETLNGVGAAKAEAIVAYRSEHGGFKSVDELANVKGIGDKTVSKNRDQMTVAAPARKPQP